MKHHGMPPRGSIPTTGVGPCRCCRPGFGWGGLLVFLLAIGSCFHGIGASPAWGKSPEESRREAEAQHAEFQKKFQQKQQEVLAKQAEMDRKFLGLKKERDGMSPRTREARFPAASEAAAPPLPSFDPAKAPQPKACYDSFMQIAALATSAEQILPFLRFKRQESIRADQARYDPRRAERRRQEMMARNPQRPATSVDHLTDSAFDRTLKFYKRLARDFIEVTSVKIEGNQARLGVKIHADAIVNGVKYKFGSAKVILVGEMGFWRFESYETTGVVHND